MIEEINYKIDKIEKNMKKLEEENKREWRIIKNSINALQIAFTEV
ncbi:MAG: hypothetical protein ACTSRP_12435 [Candidatus Helarchaeota archaeon]